SNPPSPSDPRKETGDILSVSCSSARYLLSVCQPSLLIFIYFFDLGHPFWPQSSSASSKYPYEVLTKMKERRTNNTTEYFFL
ncbi:hypothetical protein CCUS01_08995, partial [Colletotrichum cuscutae]